MGKKNQKRPPIVAVLGHVDHGKTTLLDKIRNSNFQIKEAGGITQSIGATVVTTKSGKDITFIDTPGHAAFSKMRSRGVNAADIALLVISADDGIKPQTREVIKFLYDAKVPYIVVCTKIDLPSASQEEVKNQLAKEGVKLEGKGGSTPFVSVSAKKDTGIENLLEMILLFFEVEVPKPQSEKEMSCVVIETSKSKGGPMVSVVVKEGSIRVGEDIYAEGFGTKVKGLFNDQGKNIDLVESGCPAQILGFSELPEVGSLVRGKRFAMGEVKSVTKKPIKKGKLAILIKAQNTGQLEAVVAGLPYGVSVIGSGVGDINESEVIAAKNSRAVIFYFGSKIKVNIYKLAKTENVDVYEFKVIYELFEKVAELLENDKEKVLGEAKIVATFPFNKKTIAGCKMIEGSIVKKRRLYLMRDNKKIGEARASSLRKLKESVNRVDKGDECGILLSPQLDFEVGDVLVSVRKE